MKTIRRSALCAVAFVLAGCYHAVIETGRPAGAETISIPWAHSFIYGLVPPKPVNAASTCPNGVSRVDTQHSFLNGLVAAITFGLYTPIQIDVTCASRGSASLGLPMIHVAEGTTREQALNEAVQLSLKTGGAVLVQF